MKVVLSLLIAVFGLSQPNIDALVAAVRPALPFPGASADEAVPADHSAQSKWFVIWPTESDQTLIIVRANPLHPDIQKAGTEAMGRINSAVAAAERKAQAAYDKALEQLRRTGTATDIEEITLEDEGVAGERIDAELELTIELQPAQSFAIGSSEPPSVTAGVNGATWVLTIPPNTYRSGTASDGRERFRAAETRLYFGTLPKPSVARKGDQPLFNVSIAGAPSAYVVVIRGNEALLKQVVATATWSALSGH